MLVSFKDGGQWRPWPKSWWLHTITPAASSTSPPIISPSPPRWERHKKGRKEAKKKKKKKSRGGEHAWAGGSSLSCRPACLGKEQTRLHIAHTTHTACLSIRVSTHVRALACEGARVLVRDRESTQREEGLFQRRELERITGGRVRRTGKSSRGC